MHPEFTAHVLMGVHVSWVTGWQVPAKQGDVIVKQGDEGDK